jgi:hypothetical protein
MKAREPELVDSILLEVVVKTFTAIPTDVSLPMAATPSHTCVLVLEDAYMQIISALNNVLVPELKLTCPYAAPTYKALGNEKQNVLGRLIPEFKDTRFSVIRFQDRGLLDSNEFVPVEHFSFEILLDEKPFVPTPAGATSTFTWNGNTYVCGPLTVLLRLNYYA